MVGFASLSPYKERAAYRTTVEDSVYVAPRPSAAAASASCCSTQLLDVARAVGLPRRVRPDRGVERHASRALHAACGFELVGIEREVGRKFNRWLDVAVMQRLL